MKTVDIDLYMAQICQRKNEVLVVKKDGPQHCAVAPCGSTFWSEIGEDKDNFQYRISRNYSRINNVNVWFYEEC